MVGPRASARFEPDEEALGVALGAETLAPGVLLLERRLRGDIRHGRVMLRTTDAILGSTTSPLLEMLGSERSATSPGEPRERSAVPVGPLTQGRVVYLDTETSGLAGGSGTWAFATGLLRRDADGWSLRQYLLARLDAEPDYLQAIGEELADVSLLVSYNGRAFDAPLLTTRFRLGGRSDPLQRLAHLDLLAPVRRAFGRIWPDCRLGTAEIRLLGLERVGDLPGSAAPQAWLGWLRRGEVDPLGAALRHNRLDLLSLAGLIPMLDQAFRDPPSLGADTRSIAAYHESRGRSEQALRLLESDRHRLNPQGLLALARLLGRRGDWGEASRIWETLVVRGSLEARTALAKYHEHRTRDLERALGYALELPPGPERERRCDRLRVKLKGRR